MTYHSFQSFLFSLALIGLSAMVSCNKKQDTIAIITVVDSAGEKVTSASVQLVGGGGALINETSSTAADGKASFNLNEFYEQGQYGLAVLDITVTKGSESGSGVIQVTEETTNEATVEIGP